MRYAIIAAGLAVLLFSSTGLAGARQHFMAGQDYYSQGRYQKAIDEFEEAYRLDPRPLLLYNIAQAYEKMNDLGKAVEYLKRFLEAEPDTDERTTLLNKIANLEARIAKTGIKVVVSEAEAAIFVDEKEVAKSPVAGVLPLEPGPHKVRISKKGFKDFTMNLAVSWGFSVDVDATLEPGSDEPEPAVGEETPGEGGEELGEEDEGVEALDVVPWIIAGVGGATAIVGWGAIGGMALSGDDHDKAVIADVVGGVGAGIAAAGLAWGLYNVLSEESPDDGAEAEVSVVPVIGPDGAGLGAAVQF